MTIQGGPSGWSIFVTGSEAAVICRDMRASGVGFRQRPTGGGGGDRVILGAAVTGKSGTCQSLLGVIDYNIPGCSARLAHPADDAR